MGISFDEQFFFLMDFVLNHKNLSSNIHLKSLERQIKNY